MSQFSNSISVGRVSRLALIVLGLMSATGAQAYEATYAQRVACTPDAFRLCSEHIPNADAVKVCMIANKAKLSATCRAAFPKETADR